MDFRLQKVLTSLFLISTLSVQFSWAACFLPNGTDRNSLRGASPGDYLPCDATAEVSMCCALGRAKDPDSCLPGGLCKSEDDEVFWRESCTDKTWKSPECIKLFVDGGSQLSHPCIIHSCAKSTDTYRYRLLQRCSGLPV